MSDKLVFDLAQEIEGSPNVFVRKDWINILDNQNQNYNNNQSILDTSQLSNSNKYMSYREAYFSMPMLVTLGALNWSSDATFTTGGATTLIDLSSTGDYAIGLKNWFGQMIHSFTLDYNGTTIIQQTPLINMWNSFRLMTSLSLNDVKTQGATIGFYPDNAQSFSFVPTTVVAGAGVVGFAGYSSSGQGVVNNQNNKQASMPVSALNCYEVVNDGLFKRQQYINFDINSSTGLVNGLPAVELVNTTYSTATYNSLITGQFNNLWISYISNRSALAGGSAGAILANQSNQAFNNSQILQYTINATIYLKHVHSFFNMCPLLKGVFMKMTMNLNNTTMEFTTQSTWAAAQAANSLPAPTLTSLQCTSVSNPLGGMNPLMIASGTVSTNPYLEPQKNLSAFQTLLNINGPSTNPAVFGGAVVPGGIYGFGLTSPSGGCPLFAGYSASRVSASPSASAPSQAGAVAAVPAYTAQAGAVIPTAGGSVTVRYRCNISVGATCLDAQLKSFANYQSGQGALSLYLYIPAYTFNPVFEQAYLSNPVKQIKYTDIYQYQVLNVPSSGQFNNLLTNGIANIKSVLILPFYSAGAGVGVANGALPVVTNNSNTGFLQGLNVWNSPFDPAGSGTTSPLCSLTNFNVQISGQNAIYNIQKYNFEEWNNQLYGQNAVNGGLTDGITSSLIGRKDFDLNYCYYYVNVERMLPVEEAVPKSVQILGTNASGKALDLYCFIEYGNQISIDALTGARV